MDAFYFVKSLLLYMLLNVLQPDGIFRNSKIVMVLNQRVLKVEIPNLDGIDRYVSIIFVELGLVMKLITSKTMKQLVTS